MGTSSPELNVLMAVGGGLTGSIEKSSMNKLTCKHEFATSWLLGDAEGGVNIPSTSLDSR